METTKIRIGTDIRLKIQLKFADKEDYANIQSLRAVFVNTTLKKKLEDEYIKKNRFIGRFPIEPFVKEFQPCEYNIHSTGRGIYRAFVHNPYCGFGLYPDWKKCMPIQDIDITKYFAPVSATANADEKVIDFPGIAQKYEGVYQLVIIAQIYQPGYKDNIRTITINNNNIFELVGDSEEEGVSNPVLLEIIDESSTMPKEDIYVIGGVYNDKTVHLKRNDSTIINVDISPITDWYEGQ